MSFFFFPKTGSLSSHKASTGTCFVDQAGLELTDPLAFASQILELKAYTAQLTWLS